MCHHQLLQIISSLPDCVGAVTIAVAVVVPTSLLLEDAAVSTVPIVEFGGKGAGSVPALPLVN